MSGITLAVYRIAAEARSSRQRYPRFDFMCRFCIQQCEQGCNYFVNTLLKKNIHYNHIITSGQTSYKTGSISL
jgi:hypothetical protein